MIIGKRHAWVSRNHQVYIAPLMQDIEFLADPTAGEVRGGADRLGRGLRRHCDRPAGAAISARRVSLDGLRCPANHLENVTGAAGSIGTGLAARARPDGYTISLGSTGSHALNGALYSLPYDVLNDFVPVSPLLASPLILFSRRAMPAKDLREFIARLRAAPNSASVAIGAPGDLMLARLFERETGTQFTIVPYRGYAPAMQDLTAGHIDLSFSAPGALTLVQAGSINAYAVTTDTRMAAAPDIPTFAEMGLPAMSYSLWVGLFAPKGTPQDIIHKISAAVAEALADPAVQSRVSDFGVSFFPREQQTPEALGAMQDIEKWWPIINGLGIKAE